MSRVVVSGAFDDLRSADVRFLQEAARHGDVHVLLWWDELVRKRGGRKPRFPLEERRYLLKALRYVRSVHPVREWGGPDALPQWPALDALKPDAWVVREEDASEAKRLFCRAQGLGCRVVPNADLAGFPEDGAGHGEGADGRPRVVVTGCYDWLHSGHVRFFEEAAAYGALTVVVGHDANLRLLKGEGHPLFPQEERRYMVAAVRFVRQALIASGTGWLDAEPEIERLRPDTYLVNEDGDRPEKRAFCEARGLRYVVLERLPRPGLPRRQSTDLRGF